MLLKYLRHIWHNSYLTEAEAEREITNKDCRNRLSLYSRIDTKYKKTALQ